MSRATFSHTDRYKVELQEISGELHVHCNVYVWNKTTLKCLYRELAKLKEFAKEMGHDKIYSISPNPKFCEVLCGESLGGRNGYEVMVWDLKQQQ